MPTDFLTHLHDARDSLRLAQEQAPLGTGTMIEGITDQLSDLIERTEHIHGPPDDAEV
jgi:hypothetical protein